MCKQFVLNTAWNSRVSSHFVNTIRDVVTEQAITSIVLVRTQILGQQGRIQTLAVIKGRRGLGRIEEVAWSPHLPYSVEKKRIG